MKTYWVSLLLSAATLFAAPNVRAQQVKLRATLQGALSNPFYGASMVRFKEEVEKRSENAVSIEIFPDGRLYKDSEVVDAVSSGAVEIGITASQQFARKVPGVSVLDQPFLFNFPALVDATARPGSGIRTLIDDAILVQLGVRVLWWQPLGGTVFFGKGRDIADPERLKDLRVAVPGKALEEFVAQCGGAPTALSVERFRDAVRDGAQDMVMISVPGLQQWGLWEVTDTVTYTAHSPVEFLLVINEKAWQKLASKHREAVAEAARAVERETRERQPEIEAKITAFATSKGMRFQSLTSDQVADWRACSARMLGDYMERNGDLAHRIMAAYAKLRTEPCCTEAPSTVAFTRR